MKTILGYIIGVLIGIAVAMIYYEGNDTLIGGVACVAIFAIGYLMALIVKYICPAAE